MALEELSTTMSKLTFGFFGSESEKKIGTFLFDDKTEWATSRELHGLAALTFNERECAGVMAVIGRALEPRDNTWRTIHKAVRLLDHFVRYGAERCVDHAWQHQRRVEALTRYNSAIHGRTAALNGGGSDFGGPVRKAAVELVDLLKDTDAIREAREEGRTPDALLPIGALDDYKPPEKTKEIDLGTDDAFGIFPAGSMGAKFDLDQVPGMYQGRPDRYFDNKQDPRKRTSGVEDSDYTRQALAPDLLDLDIGEAQPSAIPESQDLVRASKEALLQEQLRAQQQQLEQLKQLMLAQAQQGGGVPGPSGGVAAVPGMVGGGSGFETRTAKAGRVMDAFGAIETDGAGPGMGFGGLDGGGSAIAMSLSQPSGEPGPGLMGGSGSSRGGFGLANFNAASSGGGGGLMVNSRLQMQQLPPRGQSQQLGSGGMGMGTGMGAGGVSGGVGGGIGMQGGAAAGGGFKQSMMMGGMDGGQHGMHRGATMQQQQQRQRHQQFPGQG